MAKIEMFRPERLENVFGTRGTCLHEFVSEQNGSAFASGAVYFRDVNFEWSLWYDEMLICVDPGEAFEVIVGEDVYSLNRGDSVWLPRHTSLTYRSKGLAFAYYAVSPADWKRRPPK
jgi:ethanolamine utilization protein EutQ (cupin superfamily)